MDYQFLIDFINAKDGVTQEFPLLRHINDVHPEFFESLGFEPDLFKKHFFLFHHLHKLNAQLLDQNLRLIISPLEIRLCPISEAGQAVGETDLLKDFYLEESNFHLSEEEVNDMQRKFWQKYLALDKKAHALRIMALEGETQLDKRLLKKRYNELAQKYHPDKGGDEARFIQLKEAYQCLRQLF